MGDVDIGNDGDLSVFITASKKTRVGTGLAFHMIGSRFAKRIFLKTWLDWTLWLSLLNPRNYL